MIQIQSPYIDDEGNIRENLEKRYSDAGKLILQVETGQRADGNNRR